MNPSLLTKSPKKLVNRTMKRSFFVFLASASLSLFSPVFVQATATSTPINKPAIPTSPGAMVANTSTTPWHPSNIDPIALQTYWLDRINALRLTKKLRPLLLDARFTQTANEWSVYMGTSGRITHARTNGFSMHQWIDAKKLPFTKRNSPGGWKTNYFSENISWGYTDNSLTGAKAALDDALRFMLAEANYNGPHYHTIYHPDWNSIGVGFYFKPVDKGRYQFFSTFHYGSLEPLLSTSTSTTSL